MDEVQATKDFGSKLFLATTPPGLIIDKSKLLPPFS